MKVIPVKMSDSLTDALDELVKSGFYASRNDALRDAVRRLVEMNKRASSKDRLQVELQSIARVFSAILLSKYGESISRIFLFGSAAKGEAEEESDIDLLIVVGDGDPYVWRRKLIEEALPITYRLGRYISIKTFTEREFENLERNGSFFIKEVLNHGIPIYRAKENSRCPHA